MYTLKSYFENIHLRIDKVVLDADFHPSQRELLQNTINLYRDQAGINPLGEPLTILYLITRAWERENDDQVAQIGAFCSLYLLAADLIDDVQDDDLAGKPHEAAGPAIATNNGITFLVLSLRELRDAMEAEQDPKRAMAFFKVFNRVSVAAVAGQHRDLSGSECVCSTQEVLKMQKDKTSSLSLLTECAAILAGSAPHVQNLYRDIGENLAMLVQVRDDIRDIFGKSVSPDLLNGNITYPVASYLENAKDAEIAHYESLVSDLPRTMSEIRAVLYNAGAIGRSASAIESFRQNIHRSIAATKNDSAFHRTFLDLVDRLAESIYVPPPVKETEQSWHPPGQWHELVRNSLEDFCANMASFGIPSPPELKPWHLPQWLYDPDRKTIYYPDVEGLKEDVLPFQAELLGIDDLDKVATIMHQQAPWALAHEMFHYWRDVSKRMTDDHWHEEWAANRLAVAYALQYHKGSVADSVRLADDIINRHASTVDETSKQVLERCSRPSKDATGYGMDMHRSAITSLDMIRQIVEDQPSLSETVTSLLES